METSGQLMGQGATQAPPEDCEEPRGPRHTHSHRGSPIPSGHVSLAAGHRGLPRPVPSAAPSLMGPGCTLRPRAARAPASPLHVPGAWGQTHTSLLGWRRPASGPGAAQAGRGPYLLDVTIICLLGNHSSLKQSLRRRGKYQQKWLKIMLHGPTGAQEAQARRGVPPTASRPPQGPDSLEEAQARAGGQAREVRAQPVSAPPLPTCGPLLCVGTSWAPEYSAQLWHGTGEGPNGHPIGTWGAG